MPAQEPVEEALKRIVLRVTRKKDAPFSPATKLSDLKADSLDRVQILIALEDEYGIEIAEEEIAYLSSMRDFVALINKKIALKNSAGSGGE